MPMNMKGITDKMILTFKVNSPAIMSIKIRILRHARPVNVRIRFGLF